MKKPFDPFAPGVKKCWFLLFTTLLTLVAVIALNIFLGYEVYRFFFLEDGWSFMLGFSLMFGFAVTIPAFILSVFSVRMVRKGNRKKCIFPFVIGPIAILAGMALNNTTPLWPYILILGFLLPVSCFFCRKSRKTREPEIN